MKGIKGFHGKGGGEISGICLICKIWDSDRKVLKVFRPPVLANLLLIVVSMQYSYRHANENFFINLGL
jgi:hypothetical protein